MPATFSLTSTFHHGLSRTRDVFRSYDWVGLCLYAVEFFPELVTENQARIYGYIYALGVQKGSGYLSDNEY